MFQENELPWRGCGTLVLWGERIDGDAGGELKSGQVAEPVPSACEAEGQTSRGESSMC